MKILITGATGLIGSQVVQSLEALKDAGMQLLTPSRSEMDLLSPQSCESYIKTHQPEILIHTAWYTAHGLFWSAPENEDWRLAGLSMAKSFLNHGGRRLLSLGTCAEYRWDHASQKHFCVESLQQQKTDAVQSTQLKPATFYGEQKVLFHQQLQELFAQTQGSSLLWGRVFFPYGYGEKSKRLIPAIIRALALNEPLNLSCGLQKRDFMFAPDLGELIAKLALLSNAKTLDEVNLGSGEAYSLREIGQLLVQISGKNPDLLHFAEEPLREPEWVIGSTEHRRQLLQWEPRYTIAQGLEKTWNWWLTDNRIIK